MRRVGASSVGDAPKRVDLYDRNDWNNALNPANKLTSEIAFARRHFPNFGAALPFDCCFGFDLERGLMKVFHGQKLKQDTSENRYLDRRDSIRDYIELGTVLHEYVQMGPGIEELTTALAKLENAPLHQKVCQHLKALNGTHFLYWSVYRNLTLVGLFDSFLLPSGQRSKQEDKQKNPRETKAPKVSTPTADDMEIMSEMLDRIYDNWVIRDKVWQSVPPKCFQITDNCIDRLTKVFADPMTFDPTKPVPGDVFFWPWQRCVRGKQGAIPVRYVRIRTVSLVLDLRASTAAMSLTDDPADFANMIENVARLSKHIITDAGGYFDKQTGDGVVGHFCDDPFGDDMLPASESTQLALSNSIAAATKMIHEVAKECAKLQAGLTHGIDRLAPSIGIHDDEAVWMIVDEQIQAIGPSVVDAARLCDAADPGELLVSNRVWQRLSQSPLNEFASKFTKKHIVTKEYKESAGVYAFGMFP